ncbi:PASTA domain-containing protein [Mesorhizobium sp. LjNodule214]|uniref:PASTA domain-containing protein n=1 Tax=Mesorhizobium sp. LjNodule214 TaxID=3342252 RepID=UPI003ED03285
MADVQVPDVSGLTQAEAEERLTSAGLVVGTVTTATNSTVPSGGVSKMNPVAGSPVAPGSTVDLELSGGPAAQVVVPDVSGLTQAEALTRLTNAGLVVGTVTTATNSTVPSGGVSKMNPGAGTSVAPGSTVDLEVSAGPAAQVVVPDVSGLTRPAAELALKGIGLQVGAVKNQHTDLVPTGGILATNPPAGATAPSGSVVTLEISSGQEPNFTQYIPTVLFSMLTLIVVGLLVWGIWSESFLTNLSRKEFARGLITFLIAVATVGIAMIIAISTIMLNETADADKRFDRGKQILTILIGVLGTIVGFYFGSTPDTEKPLTEQRVSALKMMLPRGTVGIPYPTITLESTGLTPPLKWSVSPDLPDGIVLDANAGKISGTPTVPLARTQFTFKATDSAAPQGSSQEILELQIQ